MEQLQFTTLVVEVVEITKVLLLVVADKVVVELVVGTLVQALVYKLDKLVKPIKVVAAEALEEVELTVALVVKV
jgi:hypothetical protein